MVNNKIVYTEVYEILGYMDKATVMKIPIELLNFFKQQRDLNYISRIDSKDIFNPNNVDKKTTEIIAWLDLKFWATPEDKKSLIERYNANEKIQKFEQEEKYNEIFSKIEEYSQNSNSSKNDIIIVNENILTKIKLFIKKIISK